MAFTCIVRSKEFVDAVVDVLVLILTLPESWQLLLIFFLELTVSRQYLLKGYVRVTQRLLEEFTLVKE